MGGCNEGYMMMYMYIYQVHWQHFSSVMQLARKTTLFPTQCNIILLMVLQYES